VGAVRLAAQSGGQVPGQPAGTIFPGAIPSYGTMLNGGIGITTQVNGVSAAYVGKQGTFAVVARGGTQAGGMAAGVNYGVITQHPSVNAGNNVAFTASLTGGPAGTPTSAIFAGPVNNLQPVVSNTTPVPGVAGGTFSGLELPILTDTGRTIFGAYLTGAGITSANDEALFMADGLGPQMILREGNQAPGMPVGALISYFEGPSRGGYGQLVWNDNDQIAVAARITGAGFSDDPAIYATTPGGELKLVAYSGQTITLNGIPRTVTDATIIGNQVQGHGTSFADNGDLAVLLTLSNGATAVYMASVVPEPASVMVPVVIGGAALLRRRRR
jgi:hypothetical protein